MESNQRANLQIKMGKNHTYKNNHRPNLSKQIKIQKKDETDFNMRIMIMNV